MATPAWRVIRMEQAPEDGVALTCLAGQYPLKTTLYDSANNVYDVDIRCVNLAEPDPCAILVAIGDTHTPNDWGTECP